MTSPYFAHLPSEYDIDKQTNSDDEYYDDESMSKRKVAYYYDCKLLILVSPSTLQLSTNQ